MEVQDINITEIRSHWYENILEEWQPNKAYIECLKEQIRSKAYALHDIPNKVGKLRNFEVGINTQSEDVTLNVYIDNVLSQSKTISTSSMTKINSSFLATLKGRFAEFEFTYSGTKRIEIEPPLIINPKYE